MKIKMWGEILEPPKPKEKKEKTRSKTFKTPEEQPETVREAVTEFPMTVPSSSCADTGHHQLQQENQCVRVMVEVIAQSGNHVKSQQIGEAELTLDQRREELLQQYKSRPLVFLEKYHNSLKPEHLAAFAHVCSDPRTQHYSKVIERRAAGCTNKTRVKNHRYAALRSLQKEGGYFSEEQMRRREPLLYEQYIGQYLTDEEVLERSQEVWQEDASEGSGGLSHLLLNSYQERLLQNRLQEEQEREDGAQEEEEEEEEEEDDRRGGEKEWEPSAEEKAQLREEFISQMHQRFLDGKDKDFDYSEVDENPDYDNLDIVSRDAEEKYFDEDDEEEEEDDENMIE